MPNIWGDFKRGRIGMFFGNDPNLVGYWQLQRNSLDNSGNGYNGTDFNVLHNQKGFRDGIVGAFFNGSTSYVWLGDPPALSPPRPLSLILWFKTSATSWPSYGSSIMRKRLGGWNLVIGDNNTPRIFWSFWNGSSWIGVASQPIYNDNRWHCVFGIIGTNYVSLYIDAQFIGSVNNSDSISYDAGGVAIGRDGDYDGNYFNGYISEVAFFNRALSPSEISQYYNWAISNPKRNIPTIEPSSLFNPAITRRRLLLK